MRLIAQTIILLIFSYTIGKAQDTLSLFYCHEMAIENYEINKNKALLEEVNKIKLKNIKTNYLPKVDFNAQATYQSDVIEIPITNPSVIRLIIIQKKIVKSFSITSKYKPR